MALTRATFRFEAFGHPNITATHPTTLEITTENHVSQRGDCIVGVRANCSPVKLPQTIQHALSARAERAILRIRAEGQRFEVAGEGSPRLTFQDSKEMVVRKSMFASDRTIMVNADKAAKDIPRVMLVLLRDPEQRIEVEIELVRL